MKNLQRRDEHVSLILITLVLMLGVTAAFNAFAHNPVPVPAPPPPIVVPPSPPSTDSGGAENTNLRAFAISGALIFTSGTRQVVVSVLDPYGLSASAKSNVTCVAQPRTGVQGPWVDVNLPVIIPCSGVGVLSIDHYLQ